MIAIIQNKIAHVKASPVVIELRLAMRRLRITWKLHRLDVIERRASVDVQHKVADTFATELNYLRLRQKIAASRKQYQEEHAAISQEVNHVY